MDKTKAFFEHLNLPKIAEEDMQWLDRPITIKELQDTIKTLPNSKSPGIDGIPCKFYKVFAEQPSPELLKTFTAAIEGNELPPSMTEVVISVILKKGKDPQECGSYRPFSLLCCNGKLLTKLLAIRVNHIIKSIIQVGFVKGCKSSDNFRRLLHVMWNAKDLPLSAAALSPDDILVLISHPQDTIPLLLDTVKKFSEISGYKVNWSKSEVMPLSKHCQKKDFQEWRFKWIHKNMKYLGILLNPELVNMIKDNFDPLLQKIQLLFKAWDKLLISLWGRVQVIKMMVAPKLIYPLSMLPLNIPISIFKSIDKMFSEFIWAEKRARMRLARLQATVHNGGLRLPNMQLYQEAFLTAQICLLRLESNNRPLWVQIEQELNKPFNAADYLSQSSQIDNPITLHTKTIWHKIHKKEKSSAFLTAPHLSGTTLY
uniref:Reverse transcriptase domain-containing protein n=1 Tax=Sparus aurata TaxID=8175 RepID=A0A671TVA8_SPAAU